MIMGYLPYIPNDYLNAITGSIGTMLLVVLGVNALLAIYAIVAYVMNSLGVYTIAVRRCIKHPWLAWLPYGNVWILGSISDQYQYVSFGLVRSRRKVLLTLQIVVTGLTLAIYGGYIYVLADLLIHHGGIPTPAMLEELMPVGVGMLAAGITILGLNLLLLVFRYICLYNLFASCRPRSKVALLLLSLLLSVIEPFLVFGCRKKDDGMPPRKIDPLYNAPTNFDL